MSSQQNKNTGSKRPKVTPVSDSNDFTSRTTEIVDDSRQTVEQLFSDGRKLAEDFVQAKRVELESYADQVVHQVQENLTASLDKTVQSITKSLETNLDRSRTLIRDFATDAAKSINTAFKTIEARPAIPVLVALIGGTILGAFLRNQGTLLTIQNPKRQHAKVA